MTRAHDLWIRGGTCVLHRGVEQVELGLSDGRIAAILPGGASLDAAAVLDARGLHVLPGVIDSQVHLREPGFEARETIATGTRSAILGGVTGLLELPDTRPPTISAVALEDKISRARSDSWCDFACFLGAAHDVDEQARLERLPGCAGLAVYTGGAARALSVDDDEQLLRVLSRGQRRVSVRCDDESRARRLFGLARRAGRRIHLLRLAGGEHCGLAAQHRDLATAAVVVHDLTVGEPGVRAALWRAVSDGVVDVVASDHAPRLPDETDLPGVPGVQTLLPLMLEHVHAGRLGLAQLVELLSCGPARVYNVARKGRIAVGLDADLCLVDLAAERTLDDRWISSRCGWTPYHGHRVHGWPVATLVRGQPVVRDCEVVGDADGVPLRFADTLRMVAL